MKTPNKISMKEVKYLLTLFFTSIFVWIMLSLLFGCKGEIVEPTSLDISGRYDDGDSMILMISQNRTMILADLEWGGYTTRLEGTFDYKNNQVIMSGNYFGNQNISFNLFYANQSLAGGYNYNGQGTKAIHFYFRNKLEKSLFHSQGMIQ